MEDMKGDAVKEPLIAELIDQAKKAPDAQIQNIGLGEVIRSFLFRAGSRHGQARLHLLCYDLSYFLSAPSLKDESPLRKLSTNLYYLVRNISDCTFMDEIRQVNRNFENISGQLVEEDRYSVGALLSGILAFNLHRSARLFFDDRSVPPIDCVVRPLDLTGDRDLEGSVFYVRSRTKVENLPEDILTGAPRILFANEDDLDLEDVRKLQNIS